MVGSPRRRVSESPSDLERLSPVSQLLLSGRPGLLHRHLATLQQQEATPAPVDSGALLGGCADSCAGCGTPMGALAADSATTHGVAAALSGGCSTGPAVALDAPPLALAQLPTPPFTTAPPPECVKGHGYHRRSDSDASSTDMAMAAPCGGGGMSAELQRSISVVVGRAPPPPLDGSSADGSSQVRPPPVLVPPNASRACAGLAASTLTPLPHRRRAFPTRRDHDGLSSGGGLGGGLGGSSSLGGGSSGGGSSEGISPTAVGSGGGGSPIGPANFSPAQAAATATLFGVAHASAAVHVPASAAHSMRFDVPLPVRLAHGVSHGSALDRLAERVATATPTPFDDDAVRYR